MEVTRVVVLVVEDEDSVRSVIVRYLEALGYAVMEAHSGSAALAMLDDPAVTIDLVVTDLVMPEMGGEELVSRLRLTRPDVRALFLSGFSEEVLRRKGGLAPDFNFLQKPFNRADLDHAVRQVLAKPA